MKTTKMPYEAAGINVDKMGDDALKEMSAPHIASPNVHIDGKNQRFVMYFNSL